jgi:hypothetical protein
MTWEEIRRLVINPTAGEPITKTTLARAFKRELVDKASAHKGAIGSTSAFEQQALQAEFAIENIQREGEVELGFSGKNVGLDPHSESRGPYHARSAEIIKVELKQQAE